MSGDDNIDDDWLSELVNAQEALSRLTPEELSAFDEEAKWLRKQMQADRMPSPEKLVAKAPVYLRLLTWMENLEDGGEDQ